MTLHAAALMLSALMPGATLASDTDLLEARRAQIEALRGEVASQVQLQAYDLLDDLISEWSVHPLFDVDTLIVLGDLSVPVGFGSGLEALLENHLVSLLTKNPRAHLQLAHCPACSAVVVHSEAKGTVVSRGVDQPEVLEALHARTGARMALFLDFEAEGAALVLRARVTALERGLPILHARTLSTSTSSPAMLRSPEHLKSRPEAEQELLEVLQSRGPFLVPVRFALRTFTPGRSTQIQALPLLWLEAGLEVAMTRARAWTADLVAGASWAPQSHVGWLIQGRIARLISGFVSSLTAPDLYAFIGGAVISIYGPSAAVFKDRIPTVQDLIGAAVNLTSPSFTYGALQVGLEARLRSRIGLIVFLEAAPAMNASPSVGRFLDLGVIQFHSLGVEVSFCF